ncbi:MAG: hypothetical protein ACRDLK_02495, partial [Gaiellaceae bacterium]
MPGRDVGIPAVTPRQGSSKRVFVWAAAALALVAIGIALGSRIASPREAAVPGTISTIAVTKTRGAPPPARTFSAPTRAGAVAAAARSITAFDGDVLLHPTRLRAVVGRIASTESRVELTAAFDEASARTRAKLGAGTAPAPLIVLRSVPVGYRVEQLSNSGATVAVW